MAMICFIFVVLNGKNRIDVMRKFFVFVVLLFNLIGTIGVGFDIKANVSEEDSVRLIYRLNVLKKNSIGEKATDFLFYKKDGSQSSLYDVKADFLLVYFNNPDCETCKALKQEMVSSVILNDVLDSGKLKLLSVCVEGETDEWKKQQLPESWIDACDKSMVIVDDELYYLPSLPVLYLLDSNYFVILKNTSVSAVGKHLKTSVID